MNSSDKPFYPKKSTSSMDSIPSASPNATPTKPFSIKLNGKKMKSSDVVLDDVILHKDTVLRFFWWCCAHACPENIIFWLEAQIFKYLQSSAEIETKLVEIYNTYITSEVLNIDEPLLVKQLDEKMKVIPDRTLLLPIQNAIWNLLKYDSFPRFKADLGKKLMKPVNKKLMSNILSYNPAAVRLLDEFYVKVEETDEEFNPYVIPRDNYAEQTKINQATFDEVYRDKYLVQGFREFLYRKYNDEYLSSFLKIKHFYHLADESELGELSEKIYNDYFKPGAECGIVLEFSELKKIQEHLGKPKRSMFAGALRFIETRLKEDLFIAFLQSDEYMETNNETLEFIMSNKKGDTMKMYKELLPIFRQLDDTTN